MNLISQNFWLDSRKTFYFTFVLNILPSFAHLSKIKLLLKQQFLGLNQEVTNLKWPFTCLDLQFNIELKQPLILSSEQPKVVNLYLDILDMMIHCSKPCVLGDLEIMVKPFRLFICIPGCIFLQFILHFSFHKVPQGFSLRIR